MSKIALKDVMNTLTAQWYNAVVAGCKLDPSTFQLVQGNVPVGTTSESIWNCLDVVPPLSVNNFFNPSQNNVFSSDYGGVINNLKPQNSDQFQKVLGDYYSQWENYLHSTPSPTMPTGGILALFKNWAEINLDPNTAQSAYTAYQEVAQGVVPTAVSMWIAAGGSEGGTKAYNATYEQLSQQLLNASGASFKLDTSTSSSDISHTWASGEAGFIYDFFEVGGDGSYNDLSVNIITSGLKIEVDFSKVVTFSAGPLAKVSTDVILGKYIPWYSPEALSLAYHHKDNTVWQNAAPTWEDTFGSSGNMKRVAVALVVVDGINIKATSEKAVSDEDKKQVQTAVEGGFFPFFETETSEGWSHDVTFDDEGVMTLSSSCMAGNPQILGVIVDDIQNVVGSVS